MYANIKVVLRQKCNDNKKNKDELTCNARAGDEQNPLSLDSPDLRRIAGEY